MKNRKVLSVVFGVLALLATEALAVTPVSGPVEPGVWNNNLKNCISYAEKNGVPLVAVWSKVGCQFCSLLDPKLESDEFKAWMAKSGMVFYYIKAQSWDSTYELDWISGTLTAAPFIRVYFKDGGKTICDQRFTGRNSNFGGTVASLIAKFEQMTNHWKPGPKISLGEFADGDTEYDRLEAEATTTAVNVRLVRTTSDLSAATATFVAKTPGNKEFLRQTLNWAANEKAKTVVVDVTKAGFTTAGQKATLSILGADGKAVASNHITFVKPANSSANPKWITESFGFGEWTMNLEKAKELVSDASGSAYTLVNVQGSKWCPDCADAERNFLDLTDQSGANRLQKWARENQVALVAIDIPSFQSGGAYSTPTLLSRKSYKTTLARNIYTNKLGETATPTDRTLGKTVFPKETPALSGAPEAFTQPMARSGLGYLTRKGVSDTEAAKVLETNRQLGLKATKEGGVRRPTDKNDNRTGVPIMVLLRKDGTVIGRFTEFADQGPLLANQKNFDAYIDRLEELMATDGDKTEIENDDVSTTPCKLAADGDVTTGLISALDASDVYKLDGVSGGVEQTVVLNRVSVLPGEDGKVALQILNASGSAVAASTNLLSKGLTVSKVLSAGTYYACVRACTDDASFAVTKADGAQLGYTLSCGSVITPDWKTSPYKSTSGTVMINVEEGVCYRFEGLGKSVSGLDGPFDGEGGKFYYTATRTGVVTATVAPGTTIRHCKWNAGKVGFAYTVQDKRTRKDVLVSSITVKEDAGTISIPVTRQDGGSGEVKVRVELDLASSIVADSDGNPRYDKDHYSDRTFTWANGKTGTYQHQITLKNDKRHDGPGIFTFRLRVESGVASVTEKTFTINVEEIDKKSAGKVTFWVDDPSYAKAGTVYSRERDPVKITLQRTDGSDGIVSNEVKTSFGTVNGATKSTVVSWANHGALTQTVEVRGVPAGKTASVTIGKCWEQLKTGKLKTVKVVSLENDCPEFVAANGNTDIAETAYRFVSVSKSFPVANVTKGNTLAFTKLSGSLPPGLTAKWEKGTTALLVSGIPTKAGVYTSVYQVTETRGKKRVPGLTARFVFTVKDPTDEKTAEPDIRNTSCNAKARTFSDLIVLNSRGELDGLLTVTFPKQTGKVSGKFICKAGTVSFSAAKGWTELDGNKLVAEIAGSGKNSGYKLRAVAKADGSIEATVTDPTDPDACAEMKVTHDGRLWGADNTAAAWEGYYTVQVPVEEILSDPSEIASVGSGYLTLKLQGTSAFKTGKVTWAGVLPNGTGISGSTVLTDAKIRRLYEGTTYEYAALPLFKATKTDCFAGVTTLANDAKKLAKSWRAAVLPCEDAPLFWEHREQKSEANADYKVRLGTYGGIYDKAEDLGGCCAEAYETTEMQVQVDTTDLTSQKYGVLGPVKPVSATVGSSTLTISTPKAENPQGITLSFARSTGVVTGRFNLPYVDAGTGQTKKLSATYKGILLNGWGLGCGCSRYTIPEDMARPLVSGSFVFSDGIYYGNNKSLTIKRGGLINVCEEKDE